MGEENEKELKVTLKEKKKPAKKKDGFSLKSLVGEYRGEFRKIVWPTRVELVKQTTTVIITSALFGVIIVALDFVLQWAYTLMMGAIGGS